MKLTWLLLLALGGNFANAGAQKFKIDPSHTMVIFKVGHLGFSHTFGRFTDVEGTFSVDDAKPEATSIDLKIKTDSVQTHDEKRDKHLKSPDFFNSKQNPAITFKSKSVKKVADGKFSMTGDLSVNGTTKPVTFEFTRNRTGKDPWGGTRTGGDATLTLKRSEFGLNFMQGENMIDDQVELMLSVEGIL